MFFKGATVGLVAIATLVSQVVALDFNGANYIWTNEGSPRNQPLGRRAFCRTLYDPRGKQAKYADILIAVDDSYNLYINEVLIGSGTDYTKAQLYHVPLSKGCNVIAVDAGNSLGGANVLAKINIHYTDGSVETVVTDQAWKVFGSVPVGFQQDNFPDGSWPAATIQNAFGPRTDLTIPPEAAQF